MAAVVGAISGILAGGGVGAALLKIGASLLLSAASQALMPGPDIPPITLSAREPAAPRELVYGNVRKGGTIVFLHSDGYTEGGVEAPGITDLHIIIVLASHQVHQIGSIFFDGEQAIDFFGVPAARYGNAVNVQKFYGSPDQLTPSLPRALLPSFFSAHHRLRGCAGIYLKLVTNNEKFPNGLPNISAQVWGKNDILDPRTGTRGYTTNAALCLADYCTLDPFGLAAEIGDGIDEDALIEAANICDEDVMLASGLTERRYTCNGVVSLDQTPQTIIEGMLTAMAGRMTKNLPMRIKAGAYVEPTVTLTDDDFAAGGVRTTTRIGMAENFNGVRGKFVSPTSDWQPDDFPPYQSAVYLAEDGGEARWRDILLPFTTSAATAQRLAKIELERMRRQITVRATCKVRALRADVGDTVMLTRAKTGFAAKPFDVVSMQLAIDGGGGRPSLTPEIILRETSPLVYSWEATEEQIYEAAPRTSLPNFLTPDPPGVPTVIERLYQTRDGQGVKALAEVSWTASTGAVIDYEVQEREGDGEWRPLGRTSLTTIDRLDIDPGEWTFRVRGLTRLGVATEWAERTVEIYALSAPPSALSGVTIQQAGGLAVLKWDRHPDLDVRVGGTIAIRHSTDAAPTWANSYSIQGGRVDGNTTQALLPLKPGAYLLRAEDSSGVPGPATAISTTGAQAVSFVSAATLQADPTFSGTSDGVVAVSSALRLAGGSLVSEWPDFGAVVSVANEGGLIESGTYTFAAGMDLGTVTNVRLRSEIRATVLDIRDQISSRAGNVSTWDRFGGVDGGEVDVRMEARITDDDPGGAPTWSDWFRVDATEVAARGVQARAILTTEDVSYSPLVDRLRLYADEVA